MKKQTTYKKEIIFIIISILIITFSPMSYADLYLNSRTGNINLNTTGETRLQLTPGGNLNLIGIVNVSIPGNLSVGGNVSVDGSTLFVDSNDNRVGIGTTNPLAHLSIGVADSIFFEDTATTMPTDKDTGIGILRTTSTGSAPFNQAGSMILRPRVSSVAGRGSILFYSGSPTEERMRISETGNVGINATSPESMLDVSGGGVSISTNDAVVTPSGYDIKIRSSTALLGIHTDAADGAPKLELGTGGSGSGNISVSGQDPLVFTLNGIERVRFEDNGNVGIGTQSPNEELEIASAAPELRFNDTDNSHNFFDVGVSNDDFKIALNDSTTDIFFMDQDGKVGIGATSLTYDLELVTGKSASVLKIQNTEGENGAMALRVENQQHDIGDIFSTAPHANLSLYAGGSARLTIDGNDGNVGIGTTAPGAKLDVASPIVFLGDGGSFSFSTLTGDTVSTGVNFYVGSARTTLGMAIAGTGNVGIGTASPDTPLHVETSSAVVFTVNSSSTSGTTVDINNADAVSQGFRLQVLGSAQGQRDGNFEIVDLTASGTPTRLTIQNTTGNVGIGTTSPDARLHVGTTTITAVGSPRVIFSEDGISSNANLQLNLEGNTDTGIVFSEDNTMRAYLKYDSGADNLDIGVGSATDVISIDRTSGNVGIGTTSPSNVFHVEAGAPSSKDLNLSKFQSESSRQMGFVWDDSLSALGVATLTNHDLVFHTNGNSNPRMTIGSSGSVGIGTTSPSELLHVKKSGDGVGIATLETNDDVALRLNSSFTSSNGAQIYIEFIDMFHNDGESWALGKMGSSADFGIGKETTGGFTTSGAFLTVQNSTGNVGIGTTTPDTLLHVDGTLRLSEDSETNKWDIETVTDPNSLDIIDRTNNVRRLTMNNSGTIYMGGGIANGQGTNSVMTVHEDGKVGIGTTEPGYQLDVTGVIRSTLNMRVGADGATSAGNANDPAITVTNYTNAGVYFENSGVGLGAGAGKYLFLNSAGNVGIGTTTPSEVLSVNGNVSIEGTNCRDSGGAATCNNFVDIAELFPASEPVESGDIVAIDFDIDGTVRKSSKRYEKAVAGIVSTQPAIVIEGSRIIAMGGSFSQNQTLKPAVALAGRVPVKVTDENGLIRRGDFITTSSKKGIGMKCGDELKCINSIVGIAMQNQKKDDDVILVMVRA
jgi:hypothetical protein